MNGLPYYKAYPRDFIEGTIGMPFELKCAYRVVLDLIYMQGGKLPDDARYISGLLGCTMRKWQSIRATLVEMDKLQVNGAFLSNYRADNELETLRKLSVKQAENRARPNKNKEIKSPPFNHTEPESDTVDTNVSTKGTRKRATRLPEDWTCPPEWLDYAVSKGLTRERAASLAEDMQAWSLTKPQGTSRDWKRTYQTWARKCVEKGDTGYGQPTSPTGGGRPADRYRAAAETQQSAWLRAVVEHGSGDGGDGGPERSASDSGYLPRLAGGYATG